MEAVAWERTSRESRGSEKIDIEGIFEESIYWILFDVKEVAVFAMDVTVNYELHKNVDGESK
jgi:hypothetical protein